MDNSPASEALLAQLHAMTAQHLIDRLKSGEASAGEVSAAIRFLKDNGIESVPDENDRVKKLMDALPDFDNAEEELPLQ